MASDETRLPPLSAAWPRFITVIDRMREEGVPEKVDKLYLADMAEGTQYNYRQTFRSLGLTGDDDRSLPALRELARGGCSRPSGTDREDHVGSVSRPRRASPRCHQRRAFSRSLRGSLPRRYASVQVKKIRTCLQPCPATMRDCR